jgi:hypothetical protein
VLKQRNNEKTITNFITITNDGILSGFKEQGDADAGKQFTAITSERFHS